MRPVAQQAQGPSVERVLVQQLGMVVPERSAHQEDTEGELSSLIRWHVTSVYWLDRIMRALIEGFGSGNRLGQTGKRDVLRAALLLARGAVSTECYRLGVVGSFLKSPPPLVLPMRRGSRFSGFAPLSSSWQL